MNTPAPQHRHESRPTIKVPPPDAPNKWAREPCGVPGYEKVSARGYALMIVGSARDANFGFTEMLIRQAKAAGKLDLIKSALTGRRS